MYSSGLSNCRVSLYDGPHQIKNFEDLKNELKLNDETIYYKKKIWDQEESFGLTISNRAGSVNLKK